ncbi:MAG: hypothetical protein A2Y77_12535 [Planctomycetes bacterium RBG_13_62_9]|nr:MAG: hypothetical protein A2Y77_12535 [Planctomycetes bacterium RBG_13_62_9]
MIDERLRNPPPGGWKSTLVSRGAAVGTAICVYSKTRCFARLLTGDDGPLAQQGLDLYLFKHEGRWEVLMPGKWIK